LYLADSTGDIKKGYQASGIYPFNRGIFKDKEYKFLPSDVTNRSVPLVVSSAFTSNSEPPKIKLIFQGLYHVLEKVAYPSNPEDFRPLPKPRPRKSLNVNKQRKRLEF
jgi:hypothetical protein